MQSQSVQRKLIPPLPIEKRQEEEKKEKKKKKKGEKSSISEGIGKFNVRVL